MPVLAAEHDLAHPVGDEPAWSESYYFNAYSPASDAGFFSRIGIRPNEGTMDGFVWTWLPEGRSAALYFTGSQREMVDKHLEVSGICFDMIEPLRRWRLSSAGRTGDGENLEVRAEFESLTPAIGVDRAGRPPGDEVRATAQHSLASGHLEQAGRWSGEVRIGGERFSLDGGYGNRDKSWGARRTDGTRGMTMWRWFSINLGEDKHMGGIQMGSSAGTLDRGWVWAEGTPASVERWGITTRVAPDGVTQEGVDLAVTDKSGRVHPLHGEILRVARLGDGRRSSVVNEGLTRWESEGRVGYGISEYLHVLGADGKPVAPVT